MGTLDGGSQCRMLNLRNGYVNCHYSYNCKMLSCCISNLRNGLYHVDNISHIDFEKWSCRPIECKGQGPSCGLRVHQSCGSFAGNSDQERGAQVSIAVYMTEMVF